MPDLVFGGLWFAAMFLSWGLEHPVIEGAGRYFRETPREPTTSIEENLQNFLEEVDRSVDPEVEIAYWWPTFRDHGYPALGWSFITAGYRLQPRRIYPLLTEADLLEVRTAVEVDTALLDFLEGRSEMVQAGSPTVRIVVASWGSPDACDLAAWPELGPGRPVAGGCVFVVGDR